MNKRGNSGGIKRVTNKTYAKPGDLLLLSKKKRLKVPIDETFRAIQLEKQHLRSLIEEQPTVPQYTPHEDDIEEQHVEEEQHVDEQQHVEEQRSVEVQEQSDLITPQEKKRKGRGKTKGLSIHKKRKENDNGKLKVIIPPDRSVVVGAGANDFITELSMKVLHIATHDVKSWKGVPELAKNRIVAHMLDTFGLTDDEHSRKTIIDEAKKLYRYRRSRLHAHFQKFPTKDERLENMPTDIGEIEWKFLVEYFDSDEFKKMSERNKRNKAKQTLNHICGRKSFQAVSYEARDPITGKEPNYQELFQKTHKKSNGQWVNNASAEVNEKVKDIVAEKIQEAEEGADLDPIVNAAFVEIMGEKSSFILAQRSRIKQASRSSRNAIQEKLQAEEERRKRESVEINLMKVETELEDERRSRKQMEARLFNEQKMFRESIMALVSHMPNFKNVGLPAGIFNVGLNSTSSDETTPTTLVNENQLLGDLLEKQNQESEMQKELASLKNSLSCEKRNLVAAARECDKFRSLCDETDAELQAALAEKKTIEMRRSMLSSQGLTKNMSEELIEAQNQVLKKMEKDMKSRKMLRSAEEKKKKHFREKRLLDEKIITLEKKKSSEDEHS